MPLGAVFASTVSEITCNFAALFFQLYIHKFAIITLGLLFFIQTLVK